MLAPNGALVLDKSPRTQFAAIHVNVPWGTWFEVKAKAEAISAKKERIWKAFMVISVAVGWLLKVY